MDFMFPESMINPPIWSPFGCVLIWCSNPLYHHTGMAYTPRNSSKYAVKQCQPYIDKMASRSAPELEQLIVSYLDNNPTKCPTAAEASKTMETCTNEKTRHMGKRIEWWARVTSCQQ